MNGAWRKDKAVALGYRLDGAKDAPVVILGPSLGTTLSLFDRQIAALRQRWRVVRHDLRGHGISSSSAHPFTIADMAADVIALADHLHIDTFSYVGVSISGAVAQALAIDHPQRIDSLLICASAPYWADRGEWVTRAERVRQEGTGFLVPSRTGIWFSEAFAGAYPSDADRLCRELGAMERHAYAGCCDAIRDFDARDRLGTITAPTLIVAGEYDPATPVSRGEEIRQRIGNSRLEVVRGALHLLNIENSEEFNPLMIRHLQDAVSRSAV